MLPLALGVAMPMAVPAPSRVSFIPAPVPVDSRVRLRQKLLAADDVKDNGIRLTFENTIDIEGRDQPALVAEGLSIVFP